MKSYKHFDSLIMILFVCILRCVLLPLAKARGQPRPSSCNSIRSGWIFSHTFSPDLAIARLDRRVEFNDYISPICVPASPSDIEDVPSSPGQVMKVQ